MIHFILAAAIQLSAAGLSAEPASKKEFRPGEVWLDTVKVFEGRNMEAPVVFRRGARYHFIGSECTGWDPNPARSAVAESIWGPWREQGNPCRGPGAERTFLAQSTHVFAVAGKADAFIFMADRWAKRDLRDSRHVWLPIRFQDGGLLLPWEDAWDLSSFDRVPKDRGESPPAPR